MLCQRTKVGPDTVLSQGPRWVLTLPLVSVSGGQWRAAPLTTGKGFESVSVMPEKKLSRTGKRLCPRIHPQASLIDLPRRSALLPLPSPTTPPVHPSPPLSTPRPALPRAADRQLPRRRPRDRGGREVGHRRQAAR